MADLAILDEDWITHFHGVDTVVHLAANGDESAPWEELIGPNLDALANVFHAAALAGVERVIFASSNHVMGDYRHLGDGPITVDMTPMPDGPYAVTKLVGERLGRSLARAFDLTFIAIRLGWIQEGKNRPETLPHDWDRQMWLSNADLISLFDCAVEAEIEDRVVRRGQRHVAQPRHALGPLRRRRAARLSSPRTTPSPKAGCSGTSGPTDSGISLAKVVAGVCDPGSASTAGLTDAQLQTPRPAESVGATERNGRDRLDSLIHLALPNLPWMIRMIVCVILYCPVPFRRYSIDADLISTLPLSSSANGLSAMVTSLRMIWYVPCSRTASMQTV